MRMFCSLFASVSLDSLYFLATLYFYSSSFLPSHTLCVCILYDSLILLLSAAFFKMQSPVFMTTNVSPALCSLFSSPFTYWLLVTIRKKCSSVQAKEGRDGWEKITGHRFVFSSLTLSHSLAASACTCIFTISLCVLLSFCLHYAARAESTESLQRVISSPVSGSRLATGSPPTLRTLYLLLSSEEVEATGHYFGLTSLLLCFFTAFFASSSSFSFLSLATLSFLDTLCTFYFIFVSFYQLRLLTLSLSVSGSLIS